MENTIVQSESLAAVITANEFLEHWQGHRRVTRRVIQAFPEDKFLSYAVGGMRPFSVLILEMLGMAVPTLNGILTNKWQKTIELPHLSGSDLPKTREDFLRLWDEATEQINTLWPQIPLHRFQETVIDFSQWEQPVYMLLHYIIDNEIHHRGQGYVYLRSLGIEPPPFWERG